MKVEMNFWSASKGTFCIWTWFLLHRLICIIFRVIEMQPLQKMLTFYFKITSSCFKMSVFCWVGIPFLNSSNQMSFTKHLLLMIVQLVDWYHSELSRKMHSSFLSLLKTFPFILQPRTVILEALFPPGQWWWPLWMQRRLCGESAVTSVKRTISTIGLGLAARNVQLHWAGEG